MERYSEIINLPVICANDGKKIGVVKDVIFSPPKKCVIAYLVEKEGYNLRKKIILNKKILSIGKDAVIISDNKCLVNLSDYKNEADFIAKEDIIDYKVYSTKGVDFGVIKDIFFDDKTGKIEAVEVSDGIIKDLINGRKLLPLYGNVEFGQESLLVNKESVEEMIEKNKGLKNIL